MSIRSNKPIIAFKKENTAHSKSGVRKKGGYHQEQRLNITLDLAKEKLLGRPACTPHELNRIFNLKGTPYMNLNATCNLAGITKNHWSPTANDKGYLINGNFLFKL
jgi:hypothetical protein